MWSLEEGNQRLEQFKISAEREERRADSDKPHFDVARVSSYSNVEAPMKDKPLDLALCPHCGNEKAARLPSPGDYSNYRCPTCGEYRIAGTKKYCFDAGTADPRKAQIVVDANGQRWLE